MKCSQDSCAAPAVGRYTWPGRDEAWICADHSPKLRGLAEACGFYLQIHPVPVEAATNPHDEITDAPERATPPIAVVIDPCRDHGCGHALTDHFEGSCQVAECMCPRYIPGLGV